MRKTVLTAAIAAVLLPCAGAITCLVLDGVPAGQTGGPRATRASYQTASPEYVQPQSRENAPALPARGIAQAGPESHGASTTEHNMAYAVAEDSDRGLVVAGERRRYSIFDKFNLTSSYRYDFGVIKLDSQGTTLWSKTFGGKDYDRANAVVACRDGVYAAAGHTRSFGAGYEPEPHAKKDLWIIRLDGDGNVQWERLYSGPDGSDGGCAVTGFTESGGTGGYGPWILKLDRAGGLQWARTAARQRARLNRRYRGRKG